MNIKNMNLFKPESLSRRALNGVGIGTAVGTATGIIDAIRYKRKLMKQGVPEAEAKRLARIHATKSAALTGTAAAGLSIARHYLPKRKAIQPQGNLLLPAPEMKQIPQSFNS